VVSSSHLEETEAVGGPVLVAVDFSPYSEQALIWAARVAESFEVPLLVLHVVHDPGSAPGYYERAKKRARELLVPASEDQIFRREAPAAWSYEI